MASRIIGRDTYDALLAAFMEKPGNVSAAAKAAGCSWGMAKRALDRGWQERYEWARPIREHLRDAQRGARAERLTIVADEVERHDGAVDRAAALDASRALALEGQGVMGALRAGAILAESFAEIAEATKPLIIRVVRYLRELGEDEDAELNPGDVIKLLGTLAYNVKLVNQAHHEAQKMERLILGEPGEIVGHVDFTEDGANDTLERAQRAVEYAERKLKTVSGDNA